MLELDGSMLEGGGQILRNACALSSILGTAFRLTNIRAGRPKPGLQAQHLAGVLALAEICSAKTEGASLGSQTLLFSPNALHSGAFSFDIGTAGAVTLVSQTVLPALLFAPASSSIAIRGGTHVPFAPTFDYFTRILLPSLQRTGISASAVLSRAGWFPKGGGEMILTIEPCEKLEHFELSERGELKSISGLSCSSNLPPHVAQRQADAVRRKFPQSELLAESMAADCPGSAVTLWAEFEGDARLGASALGKQGKPAETVGEEAALGLEQEISSNAPVDRHLADQLMIFMALADGHSRLRTSEITQHAKTNAWLIERFTGKKVLIDDGSKTMAVDGLGLQNKLMKKPPRRTQ